MKRTFTLLLGLLALACSANAQEIPLALTGGWGWTKNMSGEVTVTSSKQWAEFKLSSISIQLSVYKGFKITFSNNTGNWQIKSVNSSDQGEYPAFVGSEGVLEHTFNTESYGEDPEIATFTLQHADDVEASITIEKVELISTDDRIFIPNYAEGWGCSYQLKSDDPYSGQFTTSSQWAEIGGSNWKQEYTAGQQHTFTLKLNSGAPDGLQLKVLTPAGDKYPAIAAGTTEFSYDLKEEYTFVSIQNTKSSAVTLDIASMTVTITEAAPAIELNETDRSGYLQLAGKEKADLKFVRTFNEGWNTLAIPTYMTPPMIKNHFGSSVKVFKFKSYSDGKLNFEAQDLSGEYDWIIDGYESYLLYITDTDAPALVNGNFTINDATLRGNKDGDNWVPGGTYHEASNVTFKATYAPVPSDELVGNYGVTADGYIRKAGTGATLDGYRAYFTGIPEEAAAKGISIVFDNGTTTGISTVVPAEDVFGNGAVYNLNGQRVGKNLAPGIYVRNGKKFIQK